MLSILSPVSRESIPSRRSLAFVDVSISSTANGTGSCRPASRRGSRRLCPPEPSSGKSKARVTATTTMRPRRWFRKSTSRGGAGSLRPTFRPSQTQRERSLDHPISPPRLGDVEVRVGARDRAFRIFPEDQLRRARGDRDLPHISDRKQLDRLAHALGEAARPVDRDVADDDEELLAAPPDRGVSSAQEDLQKSGDLLQDEISRRVTEGVIDALEVIDVEKREGEGTLRSDRARRFASDGLLSGAPVGKACQLVGQGLPLAVALQVGVLRDVGERREQPLAGGETQGPPDPSDPPPARPLDLEVLLIIGLFEAAGPHPVQEIGGLVEEARDLPEELFAGHLSELVGRDAEHVRERRAREENPVRVEKQEASFEAVEGRDERRVFPFEGFAARPLEVELLPQAPGLRGLEFVERLLHGVT